jgi:phage terminase large subunit-like protein
MAEYIYDEQEPKRVIDFVHNFCCRKDGGKITLLPWQIDIVQKLYGTLDKDTGRRRYRQAFVFVPRRNGKSVWMATLLIYHLMTDAPGSELYLISNTITQSADACFAACLAIVENSPSLNHRLGGRLKALPSKGRIINLKNKSKLCILSSTTHSLVGRDAQILVHDEIAFFTKREMYTNLKGSQLNRTEPLSLSITTASDNLEGIGKELYDYACGVRDGLIRDESFLPVIFQARADQDWTDPSTWSTANPSMGTLFQEADLAALCNEAKQEPRKESEFKQFHLNLWQHSSIAWLSKAIWDQGATAYTEQDFLKADCWTGLDLARKHDMAAIVHVFPRGENYYLLPRFFLPADNIKAKELQDHAPLSLWAEQGYLTLTPGNVIDYAAIRETIRADEKKFRIQEIGYDPYNAELLCNQQLRLEDGMNCVEVRQTIPVLAPATSHFERLLKEGRLKHPNNPVLNWHAANVAVRTDANLNIVPDKKNSRSRFDGIMAAVIAISRCMSLDMGPLFIL